MSGNKPLLLRNATPNEKVELLNNKRRGNFAQVEGLIQQIQRKVNANPNFAVSENDKAAGETLKKELRENPFSSLILGNEDPLSIPSLLNLKKIMDEVFGKANELSQEKKTEFISRVVTESLKTGDALVPDLEIQRASCDEGTQALIRLYEQLRAQLAGSKQEVVGYQKNILSGGSAPNGSAPRPKPKQRRGSVSAIPAPQFVDPRQQRLVNTATVMPFYAQQQAAMMAAQISGQQLIQSAQYTAASQQQVNKLAADVDAAAKKTEIVANGLKRIIYALLFLTAIVLGSVFAGDSIAQAGLEIGLFMKNVLTYILALIMWILSLGRANLPTENLAASQSMMMLFQNTPPIVPMRVENPSVLAATQNVYALGNFTNLLETKRGELEIGITTAESQLLSYQPFGLIGPALATAIVNETTYKDQQSKLGGRLWFSLTSEDELYATAVKNKAFFEPLKGFVDSRNFEGVLLTNFSSYPEFQEAANAYNFPLLKQALAPYQNLESQIPGILKAVIDGVASKAPNPFQRYQDLLAPTQVPMLKNINRAQMGIAAPIGNAVATVGDNANVTYVNVSGDPNLKSAFVGETENIANMPDQPGKIPSNMITLTPEQQAYLNQVGQQFTPQQQAYLNYYQQRYLLEFTVALRDAAKRQQRQFMAIVTSQKANKLIDVAGDFFSSYSTLVRFVANECRNDPNGICGKISDAQIESLIDEGKWLLTHGYEYQLPPDDLLVTEIISQFANKADHPRLNVGQIENFKQFLPWMKNKPFTLRIVCAVIAASLGIAIVEGVLSVVTALASGPRNLLAIFTLITEVPKAWLERLLKRIKNEGTPEMRADATAAVAAVAAPPTGLAAPQQPVPLGMVPYGMNPMGMVPYGTNPMGMVPFGMNPMGMVPAGYGYGMPMVPPGMRLVANNTATQNRRPPSKPRAVSRGRTQALTNGSVSTGSAAGKLKRRGSIAALLNAPQQQQQQAPSASGASVLRLPNADRSAPPPPPPPANANAARLLMGLSGQGSGQGGRRLRKRAKTSKKRKGHKKHKATRKH